MTIHVILPVHNRVAVTKRFVIQLRAQSHADYRLLLVDDGSTDGTAEAVREVIDPARLTVLRGDGSWWWGGSLQQAYLRLRAEALATDDHVLIINDDVEIEPDFIARGFQLMVGDRSTAWQAIGIDCSSGHVDRGTITNLRRLDFRAARLGEQPNCLSTRGLIMSARNFLDSGGFRPRWLPHYLSDYEFTLRLAKGGVRLACDDSFQLGSDSTLSGDGTPASGSAARVWRSALSFRSKTNPLHWSAFSLLACPMPHALYHATLIWLRFGRSLFSAALEQVTKRDIPSN